MKYWILLLAAFSFLGKNEFTSASQQVLSLNIKDIKEAKGSLRIAVFNHEEDFLNAEKAVFAKIIAVKDTANHQLTIENLKAGEYAVAIFHDKNDNGRLDTNWLGIPTEPYAFSNDAGKKWRKPSFEDAKITLDENGIIVELRLRAWKEY